MLYPLSHKHQGHDLAGRGSDVILHSGAIYTDTADSERLQGALQTGASKYTVIYNIEGELTFTVRV